MRQLTITLPDGMTVTEIADYIRTVADQVEEYFTGGHVGIDQFWTTTQGRLS